ncbi:MAG TPA: histidine kinase [Sunxiuqinia sp.]|nr:histidine kinase [Sunxiuqinia sp.]
MRQFQKIQQLESLVYLILWATVFLMTILFTYHNGVHWNRILIEWTRLLPFLLVFLLNNSLLAPRLLFKKKYVFYGLALVATFVLVVYLRHLVAAIDPMLPRAATPPLPDGPRFHPPLERGRQLMVMTFNNVAISLLIVGFNTGIKLFVRNIENERLHFEARQQQLKTELAFLKYQISPHFFMNTLNNIHALVDLDPKDAKDAIIKLSGLMRYLLYDSDQEGRSSLKKEIVFIQNYIELMRLRFNPSDLKVTFHYPEFDNDLTVPPLIFLSFIENAFKHGVGHQHQATIAMHLFIENSQLNFTIKNTVSQLAEMKETKNHQAWDWRM